MEAEWFVGPILEKLIDTGFQYLKGQYRWQTGMKKELQRLRDIHPNIKAVVFASSQAQISEKNPDLNKWIWQLRDAIDEADDVLDEFEYLNYKKQLTKINKQRKVRAIMKSVRKKLVTIIKRALQIDPTLKRLEEVVKKLVEVSAGVGNFLHLLEITKKEQQEQQQQFDLTRETGSLPKNELIGREKEKESVMQWLKKPSNEHQTTFYRNISLLSIVGDGGMGKTTLLQHVYVDERTEEFDLKMWVCVSNDFNAIKVIANILEYLKRETPRLEVLGALQETLKSEVMSKKFLLVLDDIWEEEKERDKSIWENVLAPLAYGSSGSKILITTRMDSVASMMANLLIKKEEDTILRLDGLKENECLRLLNDHAFANVGNSVDHQNLRSITGQIVKRLSGSPLAAKIIGDVLNSNLDKRHWRKILKNNILSAEPGQNFLLSILKLSYTFLPKPLQNCFAFCCIFPQDHKFDKDDLVRMWIALGFILPSYNQGDTLEDIGGRNFDVLVKKSYFDKFQIDSETHYKMHDLLHELAVSVSTQECSRVRSHEELNFLKIPKTIRHLLVRTDNLEVLKKIKEFQNLRSLLLFSYKHNKEFVDTLAEIFKASKSIRLLVIAAPFVKMIPEAIGNLIHLRYLQLLSIRVTQLPNSLSNLYHLQFLIYDNNKESMFLPNNFLPEDMNNLSNLRYLAFSCNTFPMIRGIGRLKSLQQLDGFYVKEESGYRLGELEDMRELRLLRIKYLANLIDAEEANSAKLCDKSDLIDLYLQWGSDSGYRHIADPGLDERVLDNLKPPDNLNKLTIYSFMGARSAMWMNNADSMSNLEYIQLKDCMEWQTLPPFGQLPFLKSLNLHNMPKAKSIDYKFHASDKVCVFPSLEVLHIEELQALKDWFDPTTATDDGLFPCLTELYLSDCPSLQELPYLPPKLKTVKMDNIGWKTLNFRSISNFIPLETLAVCRCPNITYIHLADEIARLVALTTLTIQGCPSLISLGEVKATEISLPTLSELVINSPSVLLMEPLNSFTSFKKLTIEKNDELVSFPNEVEQGFLHASSSLYEPKSRDLRSPQCPPSSLTSISSLEILHVKKIPKLQLLPNIPSTLEQLHLFQLESLQWIPSLSNISSLKHLKLEGIPLLKSLPDLPSSLENMALEDLESLQCLPSSLSTISSLKKLELKSIPLLTSLPDLPSSLEMMNLQELKSLQCLPSSLSTISSLQFLTLKGIPHLKLLPDLPPSLVILALGSLEALHCLPTSLSTITSLQLILLKSIPLLKSLPDFPASLLVLYISSLDNLDCLPSFFLSPPSLKYIFIESAPQLRELSDLPTSLEFLSIHDCHPELMERYDEIAGSDRHKIAHIGLVDISDHLPIMKYLLSHDIRL